MRFITDQQAERYPTLMDAEDQRLVIVTATRVYNYINQNPWITEARLRKYAEDNGIGPDQLNDAMSYTAI